MTAPRNETNRLLMLMTPEQKRIGEIVWGSAAGDIQLATFGYTADVTRTFPANGRFAGAGAAVYDLVLAVQKSAIALAAPGVTLDAEFGGTLDDRPEAERVGLQV